MQAAELQHPTTNTRHPGNNLEKTRVTAAGDSRKQKWRPSSNGQAKPSKATSKPGEVNRNGPGKGVEMGSCLGLDQLSAEAAESHSRARSAQARGTGAGEQLAGGVGSSKVADLSRRQNSFLLVWWCVPSPVLRFAITLYPTSRRAS
jgi:hypothetical protein